MKNLIKTFLAAIMFTAAAAASAGWINGYYKSDGSYTQGHWRGAADGYCWNNKAGC